MNLNLFDLTPDEAAVLSVYVLFLYVPFVTFFVWRINRKVDEQIDEAEDFRNKLVRTLTTMAMPKTPEGLAAWTAKPIVEAIASRIAKVDVQKIVEDQVEKAQQKVTQNGKTPTEHATQGETLLHQGDAEGAESAALAEGDEASR